MYLKDEKGDVHFPQKMMLTEVAANSDHGDGEEDGEQLLS